MISKLGYRLAIIVVVLCLVPLYFLLKHTPPDFTQFAAGAERKREFINYLAPLVNAENSEILEERQTARKLAAAAPKLGFYNRIKLERLLEKYDLEKFNPEKQKDWSELLKRIDEVPVALALAQAASESGWGSSRFAREGNNYFGQWCFKKGCGLVPQHRGAGKTHEVAHFSSPEDSVRAYLLNLNQNSAYKALREIRANSKEESGNATGIQLADGLVKYSERGDEYVREIKNLIRYNKLEPTGS